MRKTAQIQLRVTPAEKAELTRRARAAGLDLSAYMLERSLPTAAAEFTHLCRRLSRTGKTTLVWAELHDLLARLGRGDFPRTTESAPSASLPPVPHNQLAAMVETRAAQLGVPPPAWVAGVKPLDEPWFATSLLSLRLHLLTHSPPAFRRRNLFVDATVGSRL